MGKLKKKKGKVRPIVQNITQLNKSISTRPEDLVKSIFLVPIKLK